MSKPFDRLQQEIKPRRSRKPKLVFYSDRLPASVVRWIQATAKRYGLKQQSIHASLLLAGMAVFERERPLERAGK